jgi:hypothetical protein
MIDDSFGHANALLTSVRLPGARLAPLKAYPTLSLAEGGEALQSAMCLVLVPVFYYLNRVLKVLL